jgi:hypothetical protein
MAQGYRYVVNLNLSSYFDTVNHDILMGLVDKTLKYKDIQMYTKSEMASKMASRRVMRNAIKYLEGKLRLKVYVDKTKARNVKGSQMLGFVFTGLNRFETRITKKDGKKILVRKSKSGYCRPREKALKHFRERVREITDISRVQFLEQVISDLNSFLRGWINYYARS